MKNNPFSGITNGVQNSRFPLMIVAMVSALLTFLFFIMATMDLRRIEKMLVGTLEKQGVHQIDRLEEYAAFNFTRLVNDEPGIFGIAPVLPSEEGDLSLQEYLVTGLVDLALDIEYMERSTSFSGEIVNELADAWNLSGIIFLDAQGNTLYGQPPSGTLMSYAQSLLKSESSVSLRLFKGGRILEEGGFVAVLRPDDGVLILRLDGNDLRFWAWKIALTRAMQNMQWWKDAVYLGVYDEKGGIILKSGEIPNQRQMADRHLFPGFSAAKKGDNLELTSFIENPDVPRSLVVLGLSMAETAEILTESRRRVILSTGLMIAIGILAMGVLFSMQNRHVSNVKKMTEQLSKARRLSSLGKLGAGLAHEIRNPLNSISMAAQRLSTEYPASGEKKTGYDRITEVISLETKRLNNLVDDFLTLSSSGKLRLQRHSVYEVVSRVVFLLGPEAGNKGIRIAINQVGTDQEIMIDPDRMAQALLNILRNAIEALANGGDIDISIAWKKDNVKIGIIDNGPGILKDDLENLFDPSFTTRERGVGLGLSIAHEIVSAHDGKIRVESIKNRGTTFEITIPVK